MLHQNRYTDQWNIIKSLEIEPHIYRHMLWQRTLKTYNGIRKVCTLNIGKLDSHIQNNKAKPSLITCRQNLTQRLGCKTWSNKIYM